MSIQIIAGPVRKRVSDGFALETLNPSTSTTPQSLSLDAPLTLVSTATGGTGTGTGFEINVFTLSTSSAIEGQTKAVLMGGTGEVKVLTTAGTSTGRWVLNAADDYVRFVMHNRRWRLTVNSGATVATST